MSHDTRHEKINYIEFGVSNIEQAKAFYNQVFNWQYVDYGSEYVAFKNAGIDGGFFLCDVPNEAIQSGILIVFYSSELEQTLSKIIESGGQVVKPVFTFPGGRRFHFLDPFGNEFAVWSDLG